MARATTSETLHPLIGRPSAPVILDVRTDEDFAGDPHVLPRCVRAGHTTIPALPAGPVVVVCQKGGKLSQGVASLLAASGCDATYLGGGTEGWNGPCIPAAALPELLLWVSTEDAAGYGVRWAISRFGPPGARTMLVDADQVAAAAERFGAEVACNLPGILDRLDLLSPALDDLRKMHAFLHDLLRGAASVADTAPDVILDAAYASVFE